MLTVLALLGPGSGLALAASTTPASDQYGGGINVLGENSGGGFGHGAGAIAVAGLFALFFPLRRRRWLKPLIAVVAIASVMQLTACGNCTDLGTRPATYSIEVTGTAAQGGAAASQAVKINVTI